MFSLLRKHEVNINIKHAHNACMKFAPIPMLKVDDVRIQESKCKLARSPSFPSSFFLLCPAHKNRQSFSHKTDK